MELVGEGPQTEEISQLLEAAPGHAWTLRLMQELFKSLQRTTGFFCMNVKMQGFPKVLVDIYMKIIIEGRGKEKKEIKRICVKINCYSRADEPNYQGFLVFTGFYPFTPQGMKEAIEAAKEETNSLRQRSFCQSCIVKEPPAKRLKMADGVADVCGRCFVMNALL